MKKKSQTDLILKHTAAILRVLGPRNGNRRGTGLIKRGVELIRADGG